MVLDPKLMAGVNDQVRNRSEDFIQRYANHVNLSISLWDVSVNFGIVEGADDKGRPVIGEHTRIQMSKELAKVFYLLLQKHLELYESKLGTIELPAMQMVTELVEETGKSMVPSSRKKKS